MDAERVLAKFKNVKAQISRAGTPDMMRMPAHIQNAIESITAHLATNQRFPAGFGPGLNNLEHQADLYLERIKGRASVSRNPTPQTGSLAG